MHLPEWLNQEAAAEPTHGRGRHAEIALEDVFALSPDAILIADVGGRVRGANPRSEELFGYTCDELIGTQVEALVPERYRAFHEQYRNNYMKEPRRRPMGQGRNILGLRKDGSEVPVDILLHPVETPSGTMVLSFVRDESASRLADEDRVRLYEQIGALVKSARDYSIFMLESDGRVRTWNPGAEQMQGFTAKEVVGKPYSIFFTPEEVRDGLPDLQLRTAAEQGKMDREGWQVRKNGERFWAYMVLLAIRDTSGNLTGYTKVVRDITHAKRAAESVMLQLSAALLANQSSDTLLHVISASLHDLIPHDCATLENLDTDQRQVRVQFLNGGKEETQPEEILFSLAGSHMEQAMKSGGPVILPSLENALELSEGTRYLFSRGMRSACCVPLQFREQTLGALLVASRNEAAFSSMDAEMLMEIGGQVAAAVHNAQHLRHITVVQDKLREQKRYLEEEINLDNQFKDIVGVSTGLRHVLHQIETVAPTDSTVLIEGETGTGKELLARAIHRLSRRSESTFVKLNCPAIPLGLLESELFGHEKGAFTGAIARKVGKMELAHEGTLFLDEVGELPLDLQPKLLRALQEREIERLGSNRPIAVNVRLIAATNRDLAMMVAKGEFRSDLYYRLKVFPILAPPLRDRVGDIPELVRHFVNLHSREMGKNIEEIPDNAMRALKRCRWPGNIRELSNFIERAVILTRGTVLEVAIDDLRGEQGEESHGSETLASSERELIVRVLRECRGQIGGIGGAAARLGLKRTTLNSKMKKLSIEKSDYMPSK